MKCQAKTTLLITVLLASTFASILLSFVPTTNSNPAASTVGTSLSAGSTLSPFQRKSFYANGLFWVFYTDETSPTPSMVYKTSTDGSAWSSPTTVKTLVPSGYRFSIWFDGTYLHYACAEYR